MKTTLIVKSVLVVAILFILFKLISHKSRKGRWGSRRGGKRGG